MIMPDPIMIPHTLRYRHSRRAFVSDRGTVRLYHTNHLKQPVFKVTCKYMGCHCKLFIAAPGDRDREDRAFVLEHIIKAGWAFSVFDNKPLCPAHK